MSSSIVRAVRGVVSTLRRAGVSGRAAFPRTAAVAAVALVSLAAAPNPATIPSVDLVLNLTDAPDPVPATGLITYGITVANDGDVGASGVQFTLDVPANARFVDAAGTGATCSGMAAGATGPATLTCALSDLAAGASENLSVRLRSTTAGVVTVTGSVSSAEPDAQLSNNSVTEQTTTSSGADVALSLTAPATAASGATVSYTLALENGGPDAATALEVQFPVPTGFTLTAPLPAGCSNVGGTITCAVAGPIASGDTHTVGDVTGQITAAAGSTVSGSASVDVQAGAPVGTARDGGPAPRRAGAPRGR
jgi:uncharacterized repeat protein (TIGR01451 family)